MAKTEVAKVDQSVALQDLELITQGLSTLTSYKATVVLPTIEKIENQAEYIASADGVKLAKSEATRIEEVRKEATKPLDDFKKSMMGIQRELQAPYDKYVAEVTAKRQAYLDEQTRIEREQAEKERLRRIEFEQLIEDIVEYINERIASYKSRVDLWTAEDCVAKFKLLSDFEIPACPDQFASEQVYYMTLFSDKFGELKQLAERRMDFLLKVVNEAPETELQPIDTATQVAEASFAASMQAQARTTVVAFGKGTTKYIDYSIPDYSTTAIDLAALIKAYYLNGGNNDWIDNMVKVVASKSKVVPTIRGIVFEEKVKPNNR